ncbi:MarR family winged helix-turn-helix transcriptional regulator [Nonomuraea zeae]|uniref:MarR family transcriptional regulator n=1 Tax=Nonomuraea zeae TaxID=1642303 RepID=A0A5S4H1X7_9ACTN|nr:MarR family transcriptional regulator [Nonomuraea zeae]TMR39187.1 MarR family transcriptional regulator [Nonomuraea zeae]
MGTDDLPETLAGLLAGIHRLLRRNLRHGLEEPHLRGAEVELLRLVRANPGIGVSAAARELHLAGNSVSTLVNQLTKRGLLRRETGQDRRSACLTLTPEAESRLTRWQQRRIALVAEQLDSLPEQDRAALEAAIPALRRFAEGLEANLDER